MGKEELQALIQLQKETIGLLREQIRVQQEQITALKQNEANLQETIDLLKKKLFASSSEKSRRAKTEDPNQLTMFDLFDDLEQEADPSVKELPPEEVFVKGHKRTRKPRGSHDGILEGVAVEEVRIRAEDRICPACGSEMEHMAWVKEREELVIIPAEVKRIRYFREVLYCPACKKDGAQAVVRKAGMPVPLLAHSMASPSVVSHIMVQKHMFYLPLYRQEQMWLQENVKLRRATMANWCIQCAQRYLQPVFNRIKQELLKRDIIYADETRCQVLKEKGKTAQSRSYMWMYLSGDDGLPGIALYKYCPTRGGYHAQDFLSGWEGKYLVCDGYQGYNVMKDRIRCSCWAHIRRYWKDAVPADKEKKTKSPAVTGVRYCDELFAREKKLRGLDSGTRKEKRLEEEKPLLEAFWKWVETVDAVGGSRLAKAVTYTRNQKVYAENYLLDGRIEISNNLAERMGARPYAVGRKNFLFHDSVEGADSSAVIYSLIQTAKLNKLNVHKYLVTVLTEMPGLIAAAKEEPDGIERLLPWSEEIQRKCALKNKS